MNILLTSAGRRVELCRAFRHAYEALELAGHIVALDIDPLAPALQVADRYYLVPPFTSDRYVPALVDICRREAIDLVFPLIDPDIPILAVNRTQIEATGARVMVVSAQAARITADKWLTNDFFNDLGIATPASWLPQTLEATVPSFPVFIKPRRGSASQHTFRADTDEELRFFSHYVPDAIIQEYLPGPEITNDVVCDSEGQVLGVISRQRIQVRGGEVNKGVTIYDPAITESCLKIAAALPAIGPITVQCMMKEGQPYFTEINARLGGGVPLAIAAGADVPRWLLSRAAGLEDAIPPLGHYKTGLHMTRFDDSFFLSEQRRLAMAGNSV